MCRMSRYESRPWNTYQLDRRHLAYGEMRAETIGSALAYGDTRAETVSRVLAHRQGFTNLDEKSIFYAPFAKECIQW